MLDAPRLRSIPGVCDLTWLQPCRDLRHRDEQAPRLLIEIPHGATERSDYESFAAELRSSLPADLEEFFFVNTDIGAPECALKIAEELVSTVTSLGVLIIRSRIPRTFIDCNRVIAGTPGVTVDGLTPALASYIEDPADRQLLEDRHRRYHGVVASAYDLICGNDGLALQLHSYAPRSVEIEEIDRDIVRKLRWAYTPEVYKRWRRRPDIDVICESTDGSALSSPELVNLILDGYRGLGLEVGASATYRLHPTTMGYQYASRFPGKVICVELSRELVAKPFTPLCESPLCEAKIEHLAKPLARSLRRAFGGRTTHKDSQSAQQHPTTTGDTLE